MRAVLRAVDLGSAVEKVEGGEKEVAGGGEEGKAGVEVVEDVMRICAEYALDDVLTGICKVSTRFGRGGDKWGWVTVTDRGLQVYSEGLVAQKRYGEAVSFCVRARDGKRAARIAERVLDEYITNGWSFFFSLPSPVFLMLISPTSRSLGQEAFIHHVDSIPTSLLRPSSGAHFTTSASSFDGMDDDDEHEGAESQYTSISFLARYRDFFALYARGERRQAAALLVLLLSSNVAPKGFYAVRFPFLLSDLDRVDPDFLLA